MESKCIDYVLVSCNEQGHIVGLFYDFEEPFLLERYTNLLYNTFIIVRLFICSTSFTYKKN